MITTKSFAKAKNSAPVKLTADELIERLNSILETAPPKEQYDAIKELVNNAAVATLKPVFYPGETGYISAHRVRWDMVNAFNAGQ